MGYAPHSNIEVQQQLRAGQAPTAQPLILGMFVEAEIGHTFEYAERRHPDDSFAPEMPHIIYVGRTGKNSFDSETRLAKVLKTVAYVVTDEDDMGNPVIEKWDIKNHNVYDTGWVRAGVSA